MKMSDKHETPVQMTPEFLNACIRLDDAIFAVLNEGHTAATHGLMKREDYHEVLKQKFDLALEHFTRVVSPDSVMSTFLGGLDNPEADV